MNEEEVLVNIELENNQMVQGDCSSFESSESQPLNKEVNVLTKEQDLPFEIICHLEKGFFWMQKVFSKFGSYRI